MDGSTTEDIARQLAHLPATATHLVLSDGGNDALLRADLLDTPIRSSGEALAQLADAVDAFADRYRAVLYRVREQGRDRGRRPAPWCAVCTIDEDRFDTAPMRRTVRGDVAAFNDVIYRAATVELIPVIELRDLCYEPEHFANPIEPSMIGGERLARAIVDLVTRRE